MWKELSPRLLLIRKVLGSFVGPRRLISSHRVLRSTGATPQPIVLRDYQEDCINKCLTALNSHQHRIAVSLPTGGGKTVVFSSLIQRYQPTASITRDKTLILVHRKELALQAAKTCKLMHPDRLVEVEMAGFKASPSADIVVASVQTLIRGRLDNFDPQQFKLVIIDEAHHAAADSYRTILDHFGVNNPKSEVAVVGFSATMRREDNKALSDVFDDIVFHLDLLDLIKREHLSDVKFTTLRLTDSDLSGVTTSGTSGDFVIGKLSATVNTSRNNELVLKTFRHFEASHNIKSTLVFGIDIQHVHDLHQQFVDAGISCEIVTSQTKPRVREKHVQDFKDGQISVLINCGIFTEGTDIPNIDCILLVRPTKSKNLLTQMIGRGLRLHDSKDFCHVVDFIGVGNDVITTPTLGGLPSDFMIDGSSFADMQRALESRTNEAEKTASQKRAKILEQFDEEELDQLRSLVLTTYNNLSEFLEHSVRNGTTDDETIRAFEEPWFKAPIKNTWILNWPTTGANVHLRLEAYPAGVPHDFFHELDLRGFGDTLPKRSNEKVYTLTMFRERQAYIHKRPGNFYEKRFIRDLVAPFSSDIRVPLMKASILATESLGFKKLAKRANWRSEKPSLRQVGFLSSALLKTMGSTETRRVKDHVRAQLKFLTKGEVADMLGSFAIFKTTGLKSSVETLKTMRRDRLQGVE